MRRSIGVALALLLFSLGRVPAQAQTAGSKPEDAVRAADQAWLKVFAAKDREKSVAFCTVDGSVLAPNSPIATGHDAIGKAFAAFFALPGLKIRWNPARVQVAKSGEMAFTSGAYHMTFDGPGGTTITDAGKYVTVWQKEKDGTWKVTLDIFNSDLPLPATP